MSVVIGSRKLLGFVVRDAQVNAAMMGKMYFTLHTMTDVFPI